MDRSGLKLSIDNSFAKKYWKLNEKKNIEVCRAVTTVESIIACAPYCTTRLNFQSPLPETWCLEPLSNTLYN